MMLNAEGHLREQAHDYDAAEDDVWSRELR
jgi:hypothetical protein